MVIKAIRKEDYNGEPVQWAGYYILKVYDLRLPEPDVFFVDIQEDIK